jgi:hypothetical protein
MQMNDKSGGHRPRTARLRWLGGLVAILGIVALAACGSSSATGGTSSSAVSSAYTKALVWVQCMRAHGVPNYPDPNSKGQFVIQNGQSDPTGNVSLTVLNAAAKACQKLQPASMKPPTGQGSTTDQTAQLKYAVCMRSHGEPNFPDPASNGSITLPPGMNPESPQFQAANKDCQSLRPNGGSAP